MNPADSTRIEADLRGWACLQPEADSNATVVPLFVHRSVRTDFEEAFERFAKQALESDLMNRSVIPLFIVAADEEWDCDLPSEFVLSIFDLAAVSARVIELRRRYEKGALHTLFKRCFSRSFARYYIGQRSQVADAGNLSLLKKVNEAADLCQDEDKARRQNDHLVGEAGRGARCADPKCAFNALEALIELHGKPGVILFDDLVGRNFGIAAPPNRALQERLKEFRKIFNISSPVLPAAQRHRTHPDELLAIVRHEIDTLARPLAAVVDMNWLFADGGDRDPDFGLQIIRLIKQAKPSLPIFVWSPIHDKQTLQRAMQLGAASCFDKHPNLAFGHESGADDGQIGNDLNQGKLWFHVFEWEATRYQSRPVNAGVGSFVLGETRESKAGLAKFLKTFHLTESDLLKIPEPDVERLLRALVPEAVQIEILRFFGEGQSGSERPFVVRGRAASGRWLRPVQIKISRDWRMLAREGKGYRDVFSGSLGPSVAHVRTGPYRLGELCGMSQSFAAPEEAIRDIACKSTRSLDEWLRKKLSDPKQCQSLVDEVFDGVLDPLYKGNLKKRRESVIKAFERVSPAHLERVFVPVPDGNISAEDQIDLTPENLSRKDAKAQQEMAYRRWRKAEKWFQMEPKNGDAEHFVIRGLVIDTLEIKTRNPLDSRLRLLDRTLGVKVDLTAGDHDVALRWQALAESPIKLRGLPISFALKPEKAANNEKKKCLLDGWMTAITRLLEESGITAGDEELNKENRAALAKAAHFFQPWHPVDWVEEFHVGPTHGDLNLGNILLHERSESFFPWLIDFDKAEDNRPVVFDLAKLEVEAYHKIAQELFYELQQIGCVQTDQKLRELLRRFEQSLETRRILDVDHLWEEYDGPKSVPESLKQRFSGFFAYLKRLHKRVEDLGVGRREFFIGRAVYCFCCLKFKHLYNANVHQNAPFPAKVLLWKLEALLETLDAENGIVVGSPRHEATSVQARAIQVVVQAVRKARIEGKTEPLADVLKATLTGNEFTALSKLPNYRGAKRGEQQAAAITAQTHNSHRNLLTGWEFLFRLLRDRQLPGENRWMRELLWYARDYGVAKTDEPKALAEFTAAVVLASMKPGSTITLDPKLVDYASTGRLGNTYPTMEMFTHLAEKPDVLIKISSRGDSGGTINILEEAGIPICQSKEAVEREVKERGWAVVEASSDLCEVDKILMKLRKQANCMKVTDLAMASISAKKAALGIGSFYIQVIGGYDTKFPELLESNGDLAALGERWKEMWKETTLLLNVQQTGGQVIFPDNGTAFNSDKLSSWFGKTPGEENRAVELVVFGSSLLAAKIWRTMRDDRKTRLRGRLPSKFVEEMDDLVKALEKLAVPDPKENLVRDIFKLEKIEAPKPLRALQCWESGILAHLWKFRDMAVILFRFEENVTELAVVPFFDGLYSGISESGHPLASIVFGETWMAIIRPKADVPGDVHAWCWKILREGFKAEGEP